MTTTKSAAPHGMPTLLPHLVIKGARDAMDFYKKAFIDLEPRRQSKASDHTFLVADLKL